MNTVVWIVCAISGWSQTVKDLNNLSIILIVEWLKSFPRHYFGCFLFKIYGFSYFKAINNVLNKEALTTNWIYPIRFYLKTTGKLYLIHMCLCNNSATWIVPIVNEFPDTITCWLWPVKPMFTKAWVSERPTFFHHFCPSNKMWYNQNASDSNLKTLPVDKM